MSEHNKELVRRCIEQAVNTGNLNVAEELIATDYTYHEPTAGEKRGREGFKQLITMYRTAFPDVRLTVEQQIAEGDLVVTRWTARGTHRGELFGTAPTNKQITVQGIVISRIANGKIVEEFESYDALGMLRQIGSVLQAGKVAA
jgi:steroid delta-isomerase-like uncharacterized protein